MYYLGEASGQLDRMLFVELSCCGFVLSVSGEFLITALILQPVSIFTPFKHLSALIRQQGVLIQYFKCNEEKNTFGTTIQRYLAELAV